MLNPFTERLRGLESRAWQTVRVVMDFMTSDHRRIPNHRSILTISQKHAGNVILEQEDILQKGKFMSYLRKSVINGVIL